MKYKLIVELFWHQQKNSKQAYLIGKAGKRLPGFTVIGVDSNEEDIKRSCQVFVIDRASEASPAFLRLAAFMLAPVLREYIRGLRDGGHKLQDLSAPIKRLRNQKIQPIN